MNSKVQTNLIFLPEVKVNFVPCLTHFSFFFPNISGIPFFHSCLGGNPWYQYRLKGLRGALQSINWGWWWMKSWTCALTAQKINHILGCIKSSVASSMREVMLPHCPAPGETPPGILLSALLIRRMWTCWSKSKGRTQRKSEGWGNAFHEKRLREMVFFILEKRKLQGDLKAAFCYLQGSLWCNLCLGKCPQLCTEIPIIQET